MSQTLISNMAKRYPPDVYVRPSVNSFGILEFWRVREILEASEAGKDGFKRELSQRIEAFEARRRGGKMSDATTA